MIGEKIELILGRFVSQDLSIQEAKEELVELDKETTTEAIDETTKELEFKYENLMKTPAEKDNFQWEELIDKLMTCEETGLEDNEVTDVKHTGDKTFLVFDDDDSEQYVDVNLLDNFLVTDQDEDDDDEDD